MVPQHSPMRLPWNPLLWGWCALLVLLCYLSSLLVDRSAQMCLTVAFLGLIVGLYKLYTPLQGTVRLLFLFLAVFLSLRYFWWRTWTTLPWTHPVDFAVGFALYLAEVYGIIMMLLGLFVNIQPLQRLPLALPLDPTDCPQVDVFVPTYNESTEIIEVTLRAARQIRYPAERYQVYLLDDGGTLQKRSDPDPAKAAAAWQRHTELQELCQSLGVQYLTREKNLHAKAGNINSALQYTQGELILILDTDHVPTFDILAKTVGWFVREPRLFLLQPPPLFYQPRPDREEFADLRLHAR